ncbi:MAG: 2-C-methyl-D-erythritol 4-phosphate cytidylyltransferase [Oscillospiraceae bacterium]|jgi:2-C-methyl-D-erythritol 4-phosphate cytidylyltransferase|nr:2-C-methyl-D-erythritol 4-phosphate cytidylyltransferase [Oscillospiraceae bacterium]
MGFFSRKKRIDKRVKKYNGGEFGGGKRPAKALPSNFVSAIVPAAGSSARMGGTDKLTARLLDKPLLAHTLLALQNSGDITEIVVAARAEELESVAELCREYGVTKASKIIAGGATRAQSVLNALIACDPRSRIAAIHDGARPCVSRRVISETVALAKKTGAAAPAIALTDTLKELAPDGKTVKSTPDRKNFVRIQTPQCFYTQLVKAALTRAIENGESPTDDCAAVEALGVEVWLSKGEAENFKVTLPGDIALAETVLGGRYAEQHTADRSGL